MSRVLVQAIAAIGRAIRILRAELAESQQHWVPAALAVLKVADWI